MKKLFMILACSCGLIVSLIALDNVTHAAGGVGTLTLTINGGTSSCMYATSLNLGQLPASFSPITFSGSFGTSMVFYCDDQNGNLSGWAMSIQAGDLSNENSHSISSGLISMKTFPPTLENGNCTASSGTTEYTSIGPIAQTIVAKTSALGEICKLQATGVRIKVDVPASQAIGQYSGTLTISAPY